MILDCEYSKLWPPQKVTPMHLNPCPLCNNKKIELVKAQDFKSGKWNYRYRCSGRSCLMTPRQPHLNETIDEAAKAWQAMTIKVGK